MLNSQLIDGIIYLYLGYSLLVGFKNGIFNVIVSIFGIYGACFFSWIFQDSALRFLVENLNVSTEINPVLLFVLVWMFFYILFFVSAKLITGVLQLKGINLMVLQTLLKTCQNVYQSAMFQNFVFIRNYLHLN